MNTTFNAELAKQDFVCKDLMAERDELPTLRGPVPAVPGDTRAGIATYPGSGFISICLPGTYRHKFPHPERRSEIFVA